MFHIETWLQGRCHPTKYGIFSIQYNALRNMPPSRSDPNRERGIFRLFFSLPPLLHLTVFLAPDIGALRPGSFKAYLGGSRALIALVCFPVDMFRSTGLFEEVLVDLVPPGSQAAGD